MNKQATLKFPIKWKPYPFQVKLWNYLVNGGRQAVAVWHRRAGKDLMALHWITLCALKEPGLYWYVFPTFEQAKLAVWDAVTLDGQSYLSFIPKQMVAKFDNANLIIRFTNGSIIKFVGSHNPSNLRGAGIKGAIISEYAEIKKPEAIASVLVPMLIRSNGWALYLYTPSGDAGKRHGWDLYNNLKESESAFTQRLTIDDTTDHNGKPLVEPKELKASGLSTEQIQREFYCNFQACRLKREETTFGLQLQLAQNEYRITNIGYDASHRVNTYWDVGVVDYTVIWFVQEKEEYIDIIDCHISRGKDFHYLLTDLKNKGYKYGKHVLPHDMGRRQPPRLDTRLQQANQIAIELSFAPFSLGRMYHREEMISKARQLIAKCRFDAIKCASGIKALADFDASKRKTNSNSTMMTDVADSFCYLAMDAKTKKDRDELDMNFDRRVHRVIDEHNGKNIAIDYNPFKY